MIKYSMSKFNKIYTIWGGGGGWFFHGKMFGKRWSILIQTILPTNSSIVDFTTLTMLSAMRSHSYRYAISWIPNTATSSLLHSNTVFSNLFLHGKRLQFTSSKPIVCFNVHARTCAWWAGVLTGINIIATYILIFRVLEEKRGLWSFGIKKFPKFISSLRYNLLYILIGPMVKMLLCKPLRKHKALDGGLVVSFKPRPLYSRGNIIRYPANRKLGVFRSRSGRFGEETFIFMILVFGTLHCVTRNLTYSDVPYVQPSSPRISGS
jgi:hypothetical protein